MPTPDTASPVTIVINGGAPLGFRLIQGADDCLVVDKLRKNGKADEAGLKEGDVLVSVNGRSCKGLSSPGALSLIDSSGQTLTLTVTRRLHDDLTSADDRQCRLAASQIQTNRGAAGAALDKSDRVTASYSNEPQRLASVKKQTKQQFPAAANSRSMALSSQTTTSSSRTMTVSAPDGVQVERNADESFTMTIGFPLTMPMTTGSPVNDRSQGTAPVKNVTVSGQQTTLLPWQVKSSVGEAKNNRPPPVINPIASRLLPDLNDSDVPSTPDTPGSSRGKKLFTDSAFYDDPEHKYPTLEEQVQLARQVAMSVIAPANTNSRGHKMFMRCKERAIKYTTGPKDDEDADSSTDPFSPTDDDPRKKQFSDPTSPTAYSLPKSVMFAPKLPTERTDDKLNALSSEELERLRLSERKTTHTNVSPQVCFSLADDLRNMKGKGGQLFAKRQAKSESWALEDSGTSATSGQNEEETEAKPEVLEKLKAEHKRDIASSDDSATTAAVPVNRLAAMVSTPKAAMTPWDAAARFGNVEKAFAHLENLDLQKRSKQLTENLEQTMQKKNRPLSTIVTRSSGIDSSAGNEGLMQPQTQEEKVKSLGGNMDAAGLARIMTSSMNKSGAASASGFRQMKFKPPETTAATTSAASSPSAVGSEAAEVTSPNQIDRSRTSQMSIRLLQA